MKPSILLLAFATAAAFSSCTTAYKTGQTPDDVYFSPLRAEDEYVSREDRNDRKYRGTEEEYYDDRYLRMKVRNRYRWSDLDEWYYYGNRYNSVYYNNWNNPWTPYSYWNACYNPYYYGTVYVTPKTVNTYSGPRRFNLNSYNSNALTNSNYSNPKFGNSNYNPQGSNTIYNNTRTRNNDGNTGSFLRNIFNNGNSSSSTSNNSTNSSSSSSSGSSSGSSGSGSSAPVRKF